jgi:hypothetical protein
LEKHEIDKVFDYLDTNKDGLIKYNQFCNLMEEKFKNLDPYGDHKDKLLSNQQISTGESNKSSKFTKKNDLDDYKDIASTIYKPFYKTHKKMNIVPTDDKSTHGITTLPSDNIRDIVNHDYEKTFLEIKTKRDQDQLMKLLMKEDNTRTMDTKASIMRNQAIKQKLDKAAEKQTPFRLKQFDEVKSSGYVTDATKDIRKKYKDSLKKESNIETDSVLRIAELTSQTHNLNGDHKKSESSNMYVGEEQVNKLKEKGMEIYKYGNDKAADAADVSKMYPNLGAKAIASRLKLNKNPYKSVNKSVDGRMESRRTKTSFIKEKKRQNLNNSMLPDIQKQAHKRNVGQMRRDYGEYSKMLSNHDNNRLVMAQKTIDNALMKHRSQNPSKNQRNEMVSNYYNNKKNMDRK